MKKSEIKEKFKDYMQAAVDNQTDVKTLDILCPVAPALASSLPSQEQIKKNVNLYTREKAFNLAMENGPYHTSHTANGAHILVRNETGYFSAFSTQHLSLAFETDIGERVYDAKWLHNELYFAAAQETALFIYNNSGAEVHAVRQIVNPRAIEFLPYHFLLAAASNTGKLKYLDTSTGQIVADIFVGDKEPARIKANPANGVLYMGSRHGIVSLWSPAQQEYLMKINCHGAAITSIEIDRSGNRLITAGLDGRLQVFDIREAHAPVKTVKMKACVHHTALSQKNLLAMGYANKLVVLKDCEDVYMKHNTGSVISSLEFCNHEDILSVGHAGGVSNVIVPGSGDPAYDSAECSPFMTTRQRQELEVKRLLEKVPHDLISLESVLGSAYRPAKKTMPGNERYFSSGGAPRNALSRFRDA